MRVYAQNSMVRFDNDSGVPFLSMPKGSIRLSVRDSTNIAFTTVEGGVIVSAALADIKNNLGTAYGTLEQTVTALNALLA